MRTNTNTWALPAPALTQWWQQPRGGLQPTPARGFCKPRRAADASCRVERAGWCLSPVWRDLLAVLQPEIGNVIKLGCKPNVSLEQQCGSGSAWIRIEVIYWIRIHVWNVSDPYLGFLNFSIKMFILWLKSKFFKLFLLIIAIKATHVNLLSINVNQKKNW